MLDLGITWLPVIGAIIFGTGVTIWYGNGGKSYAIWIGLLGAVVLALGFALHLQKIVWDSTSRASDTSDREVDRQRAYVLVEASEIRFFSQEKAIEAWVALKNNGLTPAFEIQRWATIFSTKFPHTEFPNAEFGDARSVLGPGGEVYFGPIRMSRALTFEERSGVARGQMAIYVFGKVRYVDAFKKVRCTSFRLMYRGSDGAIHAGPLPLEQLPEGNDYDCDE